MTDFDLLDSVYPLPAEELYRQWVLSRDAGSAPSEWRRWELEGWTLAAHPDAHVCRLESGSGEAIGWVLEPMLQTDEAGARLAKEAVAISHTTAASISEAQIEKALYGRDASGHSDGTGLEGMWIAIVIGDKIKRVYLGPIHSVMFDAGKRRVATSQNLLHPFARDIELSRAFDPLETRRYFSFGLTAFSGVNRLLPNHYLDLASFHAVRHWPKASAPPQSGADSAAAMIDHGRRIVADISRQEDSLTIPLSAGNDSRAVLALARPFIESGRPQVKIFTTVGEDFGKRVDLQGARRLASIAGLPLEVRTREKHKTAPILPVMRNFARIGEAKSGPALSSPKLLNPSDPESSPPQPNITLAGMGGEIGRAVYWSGGIPADLTPEVLLRRVKAPIVPRTMQAATAWLEGLPDFVRQSPADILDLAYVEQRLGCWEANSRYLFPGRPKVFSFMTSGFCIEKMLALPHPYRRAGTLQADMAAYGWPEMLAVPINRGTGLLGLEQMARNVLMPIRRHASRVLGR